MMQVKELIALLNQLDPNLGVMVEDEHGPQHFRAGGFAADYGFLPQLVHYKHDAHGEFLIIAAANRARYGEKSLVTKEVRDPRRR